MAVAIGTDEVLCSPRTSLYQTPVPFLHTDCLLIAFPETFAWCLDPDQLSMIGASAALSEAEFNSRAWSTRPCSQSVACTRVPDNVQMSGRYNN